MLMYICSNCGYKCKKKDLPYDEKCSCGTYLNLINETKMNFEDSNQSMKEENTENDYDSVIGENESTSKCGNGNINEKKDSKSSSASNKFFLRENGHKSIKTEDDNKKSMASNKEESHSNIFSSKSNASESDFIEGKVVSVNSDSGFHRYPWEKMCDKFVYGQRVNDIQNTILLRCKNSDGIISDETVIIYGQIKGGAGIIDTGMTLKVYGKYNKSNEYMAKKIVLSDKTNISIRDEIRDYLYYLYPILSLLVIFILIGLLQAIVSTVGSIGLSNIIIPFIILFSLLMLIMKKFVKMSFFKCVKYSFIISIAIEVVMLLI